MLKLRFWHRLLALLIGSQLLLWALSGTYMVAFDIDFIRGKTWVTPPQYQLQLSQVQQRWPTLNPDESVQLLPGLRGPYFQISGSQRRAISAHTGQPLTLIPQAQIETLARQSFNGKATIAATRLIDKNPPSELGRRPLPIYAVAFNGVSQPTLYFDGYSGQLVTQRHHYWRGFDLLWRLHIMDYFGDRGPQTPWLALVTFCSLLLSISGLLLWRRR
ncbi:PepSY domain-containing protein [uncultured Ferrimonas sp.]|uniref:PepSY domain-containing protein n=1 Tax=uncultured Ferrimonas sp. TaxID=432640 RepID=UPI00261079E6|nr:PepSY domain-containing protein [uncultured Ferrimonas sp.]